jgi:predicted nucleic acid-binding protein
VRTVFLDATVLILAAGAAHPDKAACRALMDAVSEGSVRGHASAETLQEYAFHRVRSGRRALVGDETRALLDALVIHPIEAATIARMLDLIENSPARGRDALHAATALDAGFDTIVSTDRDFDGVPGLTRLAPGAVDLT